VITAAATPDGLRERAARSAAGDHDPRLLWPDLDERTWPAAVARVVAVVRDVAAGGAAVPLGATDADAPTFGRAAFRLGVGALLGHWIARGIVTAAPAPARLFAEHLEHGRRRRERLVAEVARVVSALREAAVEPVLLKGLDSAAFYPEPAARSFQDIDLFVPHALSHRADRVLAGLGFVPGRLREGRRRDWTAPGSQLASLELAHAANPWGVDVHFGLGRIFHWALVGDLPDPDPRTCESLDLGACRVATLPPALRLANLALHASASLRLLQLQHLLDIVFAARAADDATWRELVAILRAHGSARFAYVALVLAGRVAPDAVPAPALAAVAALTHRRLHRIAGRLPLTGLSRPDRWNLVYAFMWAATPAEALRVVWRQLMPNRYRTARDQLLFQRRLLTKLLRGQVRYDLPQDA
jgi:hypothetical protein